MEQFEAKRIRVRISPPLRLFDGGGQGAEVIEAHLRMKAITGANFFKVILWQLFAAAC